MIGGSFRVLRLLPSLKLVAMRCKKVIKTDNDITIALIMACYPYLFDNDI
jgi:hypothetical protein